MATQPMSVFVHAVGFTGATLQPIAWRVPGGSRCVDIVGHGAAMAPDDHVFSWRDAAQRLLAELNLGTGREVPTFGFGHSGGGTALLWAQVLAPGTFDALFLYEPPVRLLPPQTGASGPSDLAERVKRRRSRFASRGEFEAYLRERMPYRDFASDALEAYVGSGLRQSGQGDFVLACAPEFEASVYGSSDPELPNRLHQVDVPVVVARGERTDERFAMIGEALVDRLPQGRSIVVPDVTHFGPLESPQAVAATFVREMRASLDQDPVSD